MFLFFSSLPLCAQAATNELPALAPAYGELPPTFWELHQTAIIIGSFAFLSFVFLLVKTMLRPVIPKTLSPETLARQALATLQGQPEDGLILSAVSQILRRYVGESFNLPNHELTTAEFCTVMEACPQIGPELAGTLTSFLRECDVRKFSPASGAAPLNAASRALILIEQAKSKADGSSVASPHPPPPPR